VPWSSDWTHRLTTCGCSASSPAHLPLPRTAHAKNLRSLSETQNVGAIHDLRSIISSSNAKWLASCLILRGSSFCCSRRGRACAWPTHFGFMIWRSGGDVKMLERWPSLTYGVPNSPAENASCWCCCWRCCSANEFANLQGRQRLPPAVSLLYFLCAYNFQIMICLGCKQFRERSTKKKERKRTGPAVFVPNATLSGCCSFYVFVRESMVSMTWVVIRCCLRDTTVNRKYCGSVNRRLCMTLQILERAQ
jgi:hypothetical protein